MAARLVERGVDVVGWDNSAAALDVFAAGGGKIADSLESAVRGATGVAIAVWSLAAVEEVTKVAFAILPAKATVIVHSTIAPSEMLQLARAANQQGIRCIDVMVSGGAPAARDGRLTFMVGGIQAAPVGWETYFEALALNTYFVGPTGAGCAAKLANNIMLFINNTAILEAVKFARQFGVAEGTVIEVASASTGQSWSSDMWDFQGDLVRDRLANSNTLDVDFLVKDLELACKAANESGICLELSQACVDLMPAYYRERLLAPAQYGI